MVLGNFARDEWSKMELNDMARLVLRRVAERLARWEHLEQAARCEAQAKMREQLMIGLSRPGTPTSTLVALAVRAGVGFYDAGSAQGRRVKRSRKVVSEPQHRAEYLLALFKAREAERHVWKRAEPDPQTMKRDLAYCNARAIRTAFGWHPPSRIADGVRILGVRWC